MKDTDRFSDAHPSPLEMERRHADEMGAADAASFDRHVDRCAACGVAWAELAALDRRYRMLRRRREAVRWASRGAAVAAVSTLVLVLGSGSEPTPPTLALVDVGGGVAEHMGEPSSALTPPLRFAASSPVRLVVKQVEAAPSASARLEIRVEGPQGEVDAPSASVRPVGMGFELTGEGRTLFGDAPGSHVVRLRLRTSSGLGEELAIPVDYLGEL